VPPHSRQGLREQRPEKDVEGSIERRGRTDVDGGVRLTLSLRRIQHVDVLLWSGKRQRDPPSLGHCGVCALDSESTRTPRPRTPRHRVWRDRE
jgi:hypothetical protein